MTKIDSIRAKIETIERILAEIKKCLKPLGKEGKPKRERKEGGLPSDEDLRARHEELYQQFTAGKLGAVQDFIMGQAKVYLKAFCMANNFSVDTSKLSKDRIAEEVIKWMAQRKAITKKAR